MALIRQFSTQDPDFEASLADLLRVSNDQADVQETVADILRPAVDDRDLVPILRQVRAEGDAAIVRLTNRLDRRTVSQMTELEIDQAEMTAAVSRIDDLVRGALETAVVRVRQYHEQQKRATGDQIDWSFEDDLGNQLGQRVRPMERVGIYAPGGKASYPSSVIMTAVPAKVAEVAEIILMVPAPEGQISDVLLAAAAMAGVDRLFTIGGAQAIAALAYGSASVPRVDKIVGPGNVYVATAKAQVFGTVGIDMIAGPSEVVIVADDTANPEWLVMDMFAQAEHDEMAQSILISTDAALLAEIAARIDATLPEMGRASIIETSIRNRGALIHVKSLAEAAGVVNRIAPEHLELAIKDPDGMLASITHAGAIFIGHHTAEAMGDYCAGPSHVLPTSGTARFASPLGVLDFQVRSSLIRCSPKGAAMLGRDAAILATAEGLDAHAKSAEFRVEG